MKEAVEKCKKQVKSKDQNANGVKALQSRIERVGKVHKPTGRKWIDEYWSYLGPKEGFQLPGNL